MSNEDKKTRTVRLTHDMNARLEALCEHLGTNVNAFLITKIGEIVSTSELTFKAQKNSSDMFGLINEMISNADEDMKEVKQKVQEQMTLDQDS
jgi:predicted DNA-binding protein